MPSTASAFGLRPAYHPSGVIRQEQGTITTGYSTGILQFAPVRIIADGSIALGAAADRIIGAFMGVEWTDTDGKRRVSNQWTASTSGTSIVAYYTRDPAIVYEIQSSAAVVQADMGSQADWGTATTGNTTTGLSGVVLDASTLTNSGNNGLRIIGVGKEPDNAWGDTYCNVLVEISEHQDMPDRAAYGS